MNNKLKQIKITDDAIREISPELERKLLKPRKDIERRRKSRAETHIKELEKLRIEYPDETSIINLLANYYLLAGNTQQAKKILLDGLKQHPKYFFARINLAELYLKEGNIQKVLELMPYDKWHLTYLDPQRDVFHISEFIALAQFQLGFIETQLKNEQPNERFIEKIEAVQAELGIYKNNFRSYKKVLQGLDDKLFVVRLLCNLADNKQERERVNRVEATLKAQAALSYDAPQFTHQEVHLLYRYDTAKGKFPKDKLQSILNLPKESLIKDLETVLKYILQVYACNLEESTDDSNLPDNINSSHIYASFILAELGAEESLELVLDLLRQNQEFNDYAFGDLIQHYLVYPLYKLGKNSLDKFMAYMKEGNNDALARSVVSNVVSQVAVLNPDRKNEVIDWYHDIFNFFYEQKENKAIFDGHLIPYMFQDIENLETTVHLPIIKKFFDEKLLNRKIAGDYEEVKKFISKSPRFERLNPNLSIFDIFGAKREDGFIATIEFTDGPGKEESMREIEKIMNDPNFERDFKRMGKILSSIGSNSNLLGKSAKSQDNYVESEEWENAEFAEITNPKISSKAYNRNTKVSVKYKDGKILKDVKFKKIQADLENGECVLL